MSKKVKSSQVFEDRRAGFVVTDPAGNMHVQQFTDSGDVVLGDGTVGAPPPAPAAPHAASHENGGLDEINVAGLSGVLADPQTPAAHAPEHYVSGSDPVDITQLDGYSGDPDDVLHGDATWSPGGGGSGLLCSPLTDGDLDQPELIFAGGDVIMVCV